MNYAICKRSARLAAGALIDPDDSLPNEVQITELIVYEAIVRAHNEFECGQLTETGQIVPPTFPDNPL